MDQIRSIAADIFARYGIDFSGAKRAGGWTNATWLVGGLALRVSVKQGNESILHETRLAKLLPVEAGYPTILESGITGGYAWCLSKEIPGCCLGDVWPGLDWDAKILALRQLWEKAQAVHRVDIAAAANLARTRAWFNSDNAGEAEAAILRLEQKKIFNSHQVGKLREALSCFWEALPAAEPVLNHGDLTFDNALWHEGQVVALLDFEFAVIAPAELDLNQLSLNAFGPEDETADLSEPERTGPELLHQAFTELARPVLDHPGGKNLLHGYAILKELWRLEDWLAHPDGEGPLEQWVPYRTLISKISNPVSC